MSDNNFLRIEKKFWLTSVQYNELINLIKDKIEPEKHGKSTIYNLYLDNDNYELISRSVERPYFKEKIRLRSYGIPNLQSNVYLELKRKLDGIGYKRRIEIPYQRAIDLINNKVEAQEQIEKEIQEFVYRYKVKPKILLSYNRDPYHLIEDSSFRITFDSNLKYELWNKELDFKDINKPIMDKGQDVLLEIKTNKAIPLWLTNILSELKIYQAPFSKVGTVYTKYVKEKNY